MKLCQTLLFQFLFFPVIASRERVNDLDSEKFLLIFINYYIDCFIKFHVTSINKLFLKSLSQSMKLRNSYQFFF